MRVWRLSNGNTVLALTTSVLVLAGFVCSLVFTVRSLQLRTWDDLAQLKGLSMSVNVLGALTDVIIATSLSVLLARSRTGFKGSNTMISKLILFSVSTGALTSICAIASLISILAWGRTLIYVAFYFSLGRLYSNSILATLNARIAIRDLGDESEDLSFSLQSLSKYRQTFSSNRSTNISIKIDTTRDFDRDRAGVGQGIDPPEIEDSLKEISLNSQ
ncbi:hypothetical protein BD779DRAFT_1489411 [Infundibulicybe gibba]|nr:hypothetical protein BD779DRAFT_1489411 [Infundibulicybe gibba]